MSRCMAATRREVRQAVAEIEKAGGAATFLKADLASLAEVRRLAAAVQDATDRLDILINNAGIGAPCQFPRLCLKRTLCWSKIELHKASAFRARAI
jgi:NAD(P)-dependent dehydrogenase (short-subunit alcohol dehydrogenase family)